ncbi:hypothetical protein GQ53DRAFT_774360 [Thozetella sp. PMI_491]|nr:hypothetical protein GQ53DRAFT_774360 [Thozetella sp. PMI_491]
MAISSALCQKATDPRDSIYGLLSVYDLGVIPDYRRSRSDVYVEFHIKWLEHSRFLSDPAHEEERYDYLWNPGLQWSTELWFLALASKSGSRQQQDPSWLLDLCSAASRESVHHLGVHPWQEDMIDFGPNARAAEIDGPTLLVDGYQVDTITSACTSSDISSLEEFLRILDGWRRNHARLAARSLLDTLIRLIWWPYRKVPCQGIPRLEDAMLVSIFLCDMGGKADVANPGPSWMQKVVDTLMRIGIALDSNSTREHITNQWTDFLVRGSSRYFFVTSKGYLGAAKLGVHVGDPVCALRGCPPLMVLTKEKDGYVNMGSASAVELKQLAHQEISEKIETA